MEHSPKRWYFVSSRATYGNAIDALAWTRVALAIGLSSELPTIVLSFWLGESASLRMAVFARGAVFDCKS
jgi:hypothetical protein